MSPFVRITDLPNSPRSPAPADPPPARTVHPPVMSGAGWGPGLPVPEELSPFRYLSLPKKVRFMSCPGALNTRHPAKRSTPKGMFLNAHFLIY